MSITAESVAEGREASQREIQVSQLISALSFALDLTEGQPMGHAARSCMIGIRLARAIGLREPELENLYYALLLKDAGCSSNASKMFHILGTDEIQAKNATKTLDWRQAGLDQLRYMFARVRTGQPWWRRASAMLDIAVHRKRQTQQLVQMRCERGANIARRIGLAPDTSVAIYSLDEHWDGGGYPDGKRGQAIPLMARIMNMAQTLEVFHAVHGPQAAIDVARKRSGRWFDPELVRAACSLSKEASLWSGLNDDALAQVVAMEPPARSLQANDATLDNVCEAFAEVIDAKSHYTYNHSTGVTRAAVGIATMLGFRAEGVTELRRAALLHDIGKLSVPNTILEKPGKLTSEEWVCVRKHPYYTYAILHRIAGFEDLAEIAAAHHERLDGSGYYRNLTASQLSLPARVLAVADIYDALVAERPYRRGLPVEKVLVMMQEDAPHGLDGECLEALRQSIGCSIPEYRAGSETIPT